jgi:hypothetical protein
MFPYSPAEANAICKILINLPAESYLELALTRDQFRHWCSQRLIMLEVAENWKALHTGETEHLSSVSSNDYRTQKVWLVTVMWQRLWEMTIACFPTCECIAELLNISFPFNAPVELFAHILVDSANGDFEMCLQPYLEISSPKAEKHLRWLAKEPSFEDVSQQWDTKAGKQKLERMFKEAQAFLRQSGDFSSWFYLLLLTGAVVSRWKHGTVFAKSSVEAYHQARANLAKLDAKHYHTAPSTCWHNGVKKQGNKNGIYS